MHLSRPHPTFVLSGLAAEHVPRSLSTLMKPEDIEEQQSWLRRKARRLMGSRLRGWMESGDLAQEAGYVAWRTREGKQFANLAAFRGWLSRILGNLAANEARRRGVDRLEMTESHMVGDSKTPSRLAALRDSGLYVRSRLDLLPGRERAVVLGRIVDDLSFAEIARRQDCSEGNARVIFHRSLQKLRRRDELGGSP